MDHPQSNNSAAKKMNTLEVCRADQLENILTCQECKQVYKDPRVLMCGHSYCANCLHKLRVADDRLECPCCKQHTFVDADVILPINVALQSLLRVGTVEVTFAEQKCEACKVGSALSKCQHCNIHCCLECIEDHKSKLAITIRTKAEALLQKSSIFMDRVHRKITESQNVTEVVDKSLERRTKELIQEVETVAGELKQKIHSMLASKHVEADGFVLTISGLLKHINADCSKMQLIWQTSSHQLASVKYMLEWLHRIEENDSFVDSLEDDCHLVFPKIEFEASKEHIEEKLLGSVYLHQESSRIKVLNIIGAAGDGLQQFHCPSAVAIDWNANLVIVDQGNNRLHVLSSQSNECHMLVNLEQPRDVYCDYVNSIYYITHGHQLTLLDKQFQVKDVVGSEKSGNAEEQFNRPVGVCADFVHLYIADSLNDRIVVLDINDGRWVRELMVSVGTEPAYICQTEFNLYFSSSGRSSVCGMTKQGRLLFEIPSQMSILKISNPRGITAHNDHIFVANTGEQSIMCFNEQGKFVRRYSHAVALAPSYLAFTESTLLVVDSAEHFVVQVEIEEIT